MILLCAAFEEQTLTEGTVTHVLIGDPPAGYGIFAENMLKMALEE